MSYGRLTIIAGAALALPGAANAQFYVGIEGGAVKSQQLKYDVLGIEDLAATRQRWGWEAGAMLGYDFHGFRVEAETSYQRSRIKRIAFDLGANGGPSTVDDGVRGKVRVGAAMLNGYVDIHGLGPITPFVGAGVGAAIVQNRNVGVNELVLLSDRDTAFAWQAMGGVKAALGDRLDLSLKYRYLNVPKVRYGGDGFRIDTRYRSHSVLAGLSYSFGERRASVPPPPPPPPPPPAPAPPEPAPAPPPAEAGAFVVFFDWNKAIITAEAAAILDAAAAAYASTGRAEVQLAGHADTSGRAGYNMRLSARRAEAAKAYLVGKGVPAGAIATQAYGETRPLVDSGDDVREPQNRRVEISFGPGSGR